MVIRNFHRILPHGWKLQRRKSEKKRWFGTVVGDCSAAQGAETQPREAACDFIRGMPPPPPVYPFPGRYRRSSIFRSIQFILRSSFIVFT